MKSFVAYWGNTTVDFVALTHVLKVEYVIRTKRSQITSLLLKYFVHWDRMNIPLVSWARANIIMRKWLWYLGVMHKRKKCVFNISTMGRALNTLNSLLFKWRLKFHRNYVRNNCIKLLKVNFVLCEVVINLDFHILNHLIQKLVMKFVLFFVHVVKNTWY